VPLDEPDWWYGGRGARSGLMPGLLTPIEAMYAALSTRRITRPPVHTAPVPVICIGNLTAGGTGKTPLTRLIAQWLADHGASPVILSRGYGGRLKGPIWVDRATHGADDVGDEPLMMAADAPVMVARRRDDGARAALHDRPETGAIVLDDGLQNPHVEKNLSIAVVDARRMFGNGRVIPSGPLRAPLPVQVPRIDAFVLNGPDIATCAAARDTLTAHVGTDAPVLMMSVEPDAETACFQGRRVVAFAGIANPARFYALAARLGADVVATRDFTDHHPFTERDAHALLAAARSHDAMLLTTEKDAQRLVGRHKGPLGELASLITILRIRAALEAESAKRLDGLLQSVIAAHAFTCAP